MTFDRINGLNEGIAIKAPVLVATTAHIAHTGLQTIDAVAVPAGARVLDKDNTDPILRGIWDVSATAWSRSLDFNGDRDIVKGTQVFVTSGSVNGGSTFIVTTSDPVIGTSSLAFISSSYTPRQQFSTAQTLAVASTLGAGDIVETLGYWTVGDGGGGTYLIETGNGDGMSVIDLPGGLKATLQTSGRLFICEQYGVQSTLTDNSARIQAANDAAAAANAAGAVAVRLVCSSTLDIKDQITIGGTDAHGLDVDFSTAILNVIAGGNISVSNSAVVVNATNGGVSLPRLELNKRGAGFLVVSSVGAIVRGGFANKFIGWGHWIGNGDTQGGLNYIDGGGREWEITDTEFDTEANFLYDNLVVDCPDCFIIRGFYGWANRNIYLTDNAGGNHLISIHVFQGNAKGGAFRPVEPISMESDATGMCFFDDCQFDNGYVYDNTNRIIFSPSCRQTIQPTQSNMTRPFIRIVPQETDPDMRFTMTGMVGPATVGFYAIDHTTPDSLWTWLDANPSEVAGQGSTVTVTGKATHISVSNAAEADRIMVKRGTVRWQDRFVTNQGAAPADDIIDIEHGDGLSTFSAGIRSLGLQGIGYGDGAGSTWTQITSKSTVVVKPGGEEDVPTFRILTHDANLNNAASVIIPVTNSLIALSDSVQPEIIDPVDKYRVELAGKTDGSARIRLTNVSGGNLAEVVRISVNIYKGSVT